MTPELQKELLDKSSSLNRNLGLVFAGFLIYLTVTIGATTDRLLLLPDSNLSLPLLQIELPIIGFYVVTPLLVLGLHINLLINMMQHSRKLNRWLEGNTASEEAQDLLYPFIFNVYRTSQPDSLGHWLSGLLVALIAFYFPLVILLFFLGRFSDYQSLGITTWHFGIFLVDAFLVYYYRQAVSDPKNYQNQKSTWRYLWRNDLSPFFWLWRLWEQMRSTIEIFHEPVKSSRFSNCNRLIYWLSISFALLFFGITERVCDDEGWNSNG